MIKDDTKTLLKFNAEGIHPGEMFFNASLEAAKAVDDYVEKYGEPMYCGFANVSIHPARGRFVSTMKNEQIKQKRKRLSRPAKFNKKNKRKAPAAPAKIEVR